MGNGEGYHSGVCLKKQSGVLPVNLMNINGEAALSMEYYQH
jgi:hypothetical protein